MAVRCYAQLGGIGGRTAPYSFRLDNNPLVRKLLDERKIKPFNNNCANAVAKPVLPFFGIPLSMPLLNNVVQAGVSDISATVCNMADTVMRTYFGRSLGVVAGKDVFMRQFLYEHQRLDTAGGIVKDVVARIKSGSMMMDDTILIVGGDIRTSGLNIAEFLAEHEKSKADITVLLAQVPREEAFRLGMAVRDGDDTESLGRIAMTVERNKKPVVENFSVWGEIRQNSDLMRRIMGFIEKPPHLVLDKVKSTEKLKEGVKIEEVLQKHGVGALSPSLLGNASVLAIKASLLYEYAPLVINLSTDSSVSADTWRESYDINSAFSDFGGQLIPTFVGSRSLEVTFPETAIGNIRRKLIDNLRQGLPAVFGFRHTGGWSDDGTLPDILKAHRQILDDIVRNGRNASWPIEWRDVLGGYPEGVFTMSDYDRNVCEIIAPVFIGKNVKILPGAVIGPYAVINNGWTVTGTVRGIEKVSVLAAATELDSFYFGKYGWRRHEVPAGMVIEDALIGAGFEPHFINEEGKPARKDHIKNAVAVSNGSQTVISPIDICL